MEQTVKDLIKKASETKEAPAAINFSQAALNAANAMRALAELKKNEG